MRGCCRPATLAMLLDMQHVIEIIDYRRGHCGKDLHGLCGTRACRNQNGLV